MTQPPVIQQANSRTGSSRLMPMVIYLCHLAFFVTGIGPLVGVFLAYLNRGTGPEWIESHYRYQIRTFWIGLLYSTVGVVTLLVLIGWLVLLATAIWLILRCARGLTWLDRGEAVPDPATWGV